MEGETDDVPPATAVASSTVLSSPAAAFSVAATSPPIRHIDLTTATYSSVVIIAYSSTPSCIHRITRTSPARLRLSTSLSTAV